MNRSISFLLFEFAPRVFMEFLWLLFSVALGMFLVAQAAQVALDPIINVYSGWLVMVLFNAALLRHVMRYGLDWIDKELDRLNQQQQQQREMIRVGFLFAIRQALGRRPPADQQQAPEDTQE